MEKFVASSGRVVKAGREDGSLVFGKLDGYLSGESAFDAEEFFQAKRDAELGRWRDPVEPDYVCYPVGDGETVRVVGERSGISSWLNRKVEATDTGAHGVAYRFFETHPEATLWDDAKVGEIWAVTAFGLERPCRVIEANLSTEREGGIAFLPIDELGARWFRPSQSVTAARRIYPVDAS